jgi:hypothetical protein
VKYGFRFWLGWIVGFAGTLAASAAAWTAAIGALFGPIRGPELASLWALAVFGTWFCAVVPFMWKKEAIWKRLNVDENRAVKIFWGSMAAFLAAVVALTFFWTWKLRGRISSPEGGLDPLWIKAVLTSVLLVALPFLVFLYRKADELFRTAAARQNPPPARFRTAYLEPSQRLLGEEVRRKLTRETALFPGGHVVTAVLKDGRRVPDVFVAEGREVLGVYGRERFDFRGDDVVDVEILTREALPPYDEAQWLRIDGRRSF